MGSNPPELRIALTADLHYGTRHTAGKLAALELVAHLFERQPDAVILAGALVALGLVAYARIEGGTQATSR